MGLTVFVLGCLVGCPMATPEKALGAPPAEHQAASAPEAATQSKGSTSMEQAIFGAGCFWGVEAAFRNVKGISATEVGYSGGNFPNPTYQDVCTGGTGHAEVVRVTYDPSKVTYDALLDVFWESHDPTQFNRQGPDVGAQYRSAIFYTTPEQRDAAMASKKKLDESGKYKKPIVTEITPASAFYRAEDYHQQYLEKRGLATCHF